MAQSYTIDGAALVSVIAKKASAGKSVILARTVDVPKGCEEVAMMVEKAATVVMVRSQTLCGQRR